MLLKYNNEQYNLNSDSIIPTVIEKINEALESKDTVFSHLVVNGVEVYENHEEYLKLHKNEITETEIIISDMKEMIWNTMKSIHEYLVGAMPALEDLINNSYQSFSKSTWEGIDQLAEAMQWILQFKEVTSSAHSQPAHWTEIEKHILTCEESFSKLMEAVEIKDTILISDILAYEITPAFQSLENQLAEALKDREYLKNVN
ncbi:hypothetical protein VBD025_07605 [Virgibacillus flavescens]|uniref:hypothetical protein n=1 Tax=Virgibacillus flavescens TaxID=1611422 RepID=UPI003D33D3F6